MNDELDYITTHDSHSTHLALEQHSATLDKLEASIVALESVTAFFDTNTTPSLEDLALADLAMGAATADTDITPEDLVPSLESFVGRQVATENLRDTLKKYYDIVIDFITKLYQNLRVFLEKFFDDVEPLKVKLENHVKLLDTKKDQSPGKAEVMVGPSVRKLATAYKLPKEFRDLVGPLGILRSVSETIFDQHATLVSGLSREIISANSRNTESSTTQLEEVNKLVQTRITPIASFFPHEVTSSDYTHRTDFLFDNHAVFARLPKEGKKDKQETQVSVATNLRTIAFKVDTTLQAGVTQGYGEDFKSKAGMHSMTAFTVSQQKLLCLNAIDILKVLLKYRDKHQSNLERQSKDSAREAKRFAGAVSGTATLVADGTRRIDDPEALKAILSYHSSIAKWSVEPFSSLSLYCVSAVKNVYRVLVAHELNLE